MARADPSTQASQANIGDMITDINRSQNTILDYSITADGTTTNKNLCLLRGCRLEKSHPESRYDYGLKRDYSHGAADYLLRIMISSTHDAIEELIPLCKRNTRGVIEIRDWKLTVNADDPAKAKTVTIKGKCFEYVFTKPDDSAQQPDDIEFRIRVTDELVTFS